MLNRLKDDGIGSTHRPGLCPEDEAPTGQLTNEIISGRLESS